MGVSPCAFRSLLHFEKCLQPKNAPLARGDGCAASNIKCLSLSINAFLLLA